MEIASKLQHVWKLASDSKRIYFAQRSCNELFPCRKRSTEGRRSCLEADPCIADILQVPVLGGSPPTVLAPHQQGVAGITSDTTHVYWANSTSGEILRTAKDGAQAVSLASGLHTPLDIVVDGETVYFAEFGDWLGEGETMVLFLRYQSRVVASPNSSALSDRWLSL